MKQTLLNKLGVKATGDIPAADLFNPTINRETYGLDADDLERLKNLKIFCSEYSAEVPIKKGTTISNSHEACRLMYDILRDLGHEEVWAVYINSDNTVIDRVKICIGGLDKTTIDSRRILRICLELNASGVILYHNHPSGTPEPSPADIKQTAQISEMFKVFDIPLLDHIIISNASYFSFQEEKTLKP